MKLKLTIYIIDLLIFNKMQLFACTKPLHAKRLCIFKGRAQSFNVTICFNFYGNKTKFVI